MAIFRTTQPVRNPRIAYDLGCSLQETRLYKGGAYVTTLWQEGDRIGFSIDETKSLFQPIIQSAERLAYVERLDNLPPTIH